MNISYKWLREYVDTDLTVQEVAAALTSGGLEVDGVEEVQTIKGGLQGLVVGVRDGNVSTLVCLPFRDKAFLTAVLYLGIGCSVFAFWLSNAAIEKLGVNRAASFIGVATLVSVLTGTLMLREPLTPVQIVGAVLIVLGVYMANAGRAR